MSLISEWSSYASAWSEIAATLTGLLFVAVSINLPRVIATPGLPGRAAESMLQLFGVTAIMSSALVPRQSLSEYGAEVLALSGSLWLFQTAIQIRYFRMKAKHPRRWGFGRMAQTLFASAPFGICGVLLLLGSPSAMYWLIPVACFRALQDLPTHGPLNRDFAIMREVEHA